jgi:hypothetical protein
MFLLNDKNELQEDLQVKYCWRDKARVCSRSCAAFRFEENKDGEQWVELYCLGSDNVLTYVLKEKD